MNDDFKKDFEELMGFPPFEWQKRLFHDYFARDRIPAALDIPTGLGKTSVMAIWYLALKARAVVPRRLVYVVDRRAVVDQATTVADEIREKSEGSELSVSTLRGQHVDNREWLADPAASAIVVGKEINKMPKTLFILILMVGLAHPSMASNSNNDLEGWYTYWGWGWVTNKYPDELQRELNKPVRGPRSLNRSSKALDLLGFYWPLNDKTLIGGIINTNTDARETTYKQTTAIYSLSNTLLALSAMHFPSCLIGTGPFMRMDLGVARLGLTERLQGEWTYDYQGKTRNVREFKTTQEDWGWGLLLGGGYGIPIIRGTRLLVNANYSLRRIKGDQNSSFALSLNGLF